MVPHFSNVLGQFLGWGRNPGLPHFGTLLVHPPLYNVMGAGRAANRSTREGSGKPCKYFPPRPEFFSYFRLFVCITRFGNSVATFKFYLFNSDVLKTSYL